MPGDSTDDGVIYGVKSKWPNLRVIVEKSGDVCGRIYDDGQRVLGYVRQNVSVRSG